MEVLERTQRKVVVRQRRHELLRAVVGCLLLTALFYLLDARHPKSSLYCTRHAIMPDNELEAAKGLHVEDIDCRLVVRPTRTALDLTFFGEISYSFEIVSARLVRPPSRPPDDHCLSRCSPGKACSCRGHAGAEQGERKLLVRSHVEIAAPESEEVDVDAGRSFNDLRGRNGAEEPENMLDSTPLAVALYNEDARRSGRLLRISRDTGTDLPQLVSRRVNEHTQASGVESHNRGDIRRLSGGSPENGASEGNGGGNGARKGDLDDGGSGKDRGTHHSLHMGVNDVATLVLEDNQGITYDFYTFQDETVAESMLAKVQNFIREAREGADGGSAAAADGDDGAADSSAADKADEEDADDRGEQSPLELQVLYDDSWLDEVACALFLVLSLALMTRPFTEVVEFDAESGAMAVDRWNLFQCGVFRYSCALENVSKLEITEANVYVMSAHAFEHLRQTKEFGLRIVFSLPFGPGRMPVLSPPAARIANASVSSGGNTGGANAAGGFDTAPLTRAASVQSSPSARRQRCAMFLMRVACLWRGRRVAGWRRRFCGGRRAVTRTSSTAGGFIYLDLLFGRTALDDRKLRGPVELVNDLLLRFANDMEGSGGQTREGGSDGNCCVCFRRKARVVTFPCMHLATCPHCSESLSACPLCRTSISEKHTVFL